MAYKTAELEFRSDLYKDLLPQNGDNTLTAKKDIRILFPESWVGRDLAWVEGIITVLSKFMILCDGQYTVMNDCSYIPLTPDSIGLTTVDGVSHYEFIFNAGSVVCPNDNVLIDEDILYLIFTEFVEKGRVPPYFSSTHLSTMYINSKVATGRVLSADNSINEMVAGSITRQKGSELTQLRFVKKSERSKPVYVAFRSPIYMAQTTMTKLSTAYFQDGVTSALLTETVKIEPMERIARA